MGILTIEFDDGYKDTYLSCIDMLDERDIKCTFSAPTRTIGGKLENRPVISRHDILSLSSKGHEIASHTSRHVNLLDLYISEGEKSVRHEMEVSRKELSVITKGDIRSFTFPFIDANNNRPLREISGEYYSSSRITTEHIAFNLLPGKDPFSVIGVALTVDIEMRRYNELLDILQHRDLWLVEVFHLVSHNNTKSAHRDGAYRFFTHSDEFKYHLDSILDRNIEVMTRREAIMRHYGHTCPEGSSVH